LDSNNPQEGLRLSKKTYTLSTSDEFHQNNYQKGIADSLFNQTRINLHFGDYQLALSQSLNTLPIYNDLRDPVRQAQTLLNLGAIYLSLNEFNKAMSTLIKALDIARHLDDPQPLGETLLNIGSTYLRAGESGKALTEFKKSLQIFKTADNAKMMAFVYCNLAAANMLEGDKALFNQYIDRGEKFADQIGSNYIKINVLLQKGQYEINVGNLEAAHGYFQESLRLAKRQGYQADEIASIIWISEVNYRWGKLDEAVVLLNEALTAAKNNGYDEGRVNAHQKLSQIFEELGDYFHAFEHLKNYYEINQHINAEKNDLKYNSLETVYRTQVMQSEARIIQTKNHQLEKEISERKWMEDALRQSEDKYRRLASLDPLTGLNNRRFFYQLALSEMRRIKRYGHPATLLIIDIDRFKNINDQFGHLAGDDVLKMVAHYIRTFVREVDILGRFGGEEFILLLPETNLERARQVAQRLCVQFSESRFDINDQKIQVQVSIGVAAYEDDMPLDFLIDHADQAMQVAKKAGRNRVCIWGETEN
jgi:diguanylate cyclase (GGDEF)-like protein